MAGDGFPKTNSRHLNDRQGNDCQMTVITENLSPLDLEIPVSITIDKQGNFKIEHCFDVQHHCPLRELMHGGLSDYLQISFETSGKYLVQRRTNVQCDSADCQLVSQHEVVSLATNLHWHGLQSLSVQTLISAPQEDLGNNYLVGVDFRVIGSFNSDVRENTEVIDLIRRLVTIFNRILQ